jgi:hypothetical protein
LRYKDDVVIAFVNDGDLRGRALVVSKLDPIGYIPNDLPGPASKFDKSEHSSSLIQSVNAAYGHNDFRFKLADHDWKIHYGADLYNSEEPELWDYFSRTGEVSDTRIKTLYGRIFCVAFAWRNEADAAEVWTGAPTICHIRVLTYKYLFSLLGA